MDDKLAKIFMSMFNLRPEELGGASMKTVRSWDSLKHIELMMSIEEEFQLPAITPDEIVKMTSVEQIKLVLGQKGIQV